MIKTGFTDKFDYWRCVIKPKHYRLGYGFKIIDMNNNIYFITENDIIKDEIGNMYFFAY